MPTLGLAGAPSRVDPGETANYSESEPGQCGVESHRATYSRPTVSVFLHHYRLSLADGTVPSWARLPRRQDMQVWWSSSTYSIRNSAVRKCCTTVVEVN